MNQEKAEHYAYKNSEVPNSDYSMCEYCAKILKDCIHDEKEIPEGVTENFIKSLVKLTKNEIHIGPNCEDLYHDLIAIYAYDEKHTNNSEYYSNFCLGALYGITSFLRE